MLVSGIRYLEIVGMSYPADTKRLKYSSKWRSESQARRMSSS